MALGSRGVELAVYIPVSRTVVPDGMGFGLAVLEELVAEIRQ